MAYSNHATALSISANSSHIIHLGSLNEWICYNMFQPVYSIVDVIPEPIDTSIQ